MALALALGTVGILLLPFLSFSWYAPRVRLPLETASVFATALTAAMAYLRYSIGGRRSWLLISIGFLAIAANQVVFGIVLSPSEVGYQGGAYLWVTARIFAAVILLTAGLAADRYDRVGRRANLVAAKLAATLLLALLVLQLGVWSVRDDLPPLVDRDAVVVPHVLSGFQPGLTAMDLALGVLGAGLFLWAAWAFAHERGADTQARTWLSAALVLAAFAHIHYMLVPTVFSDHIATGDILRLAMSGVLLGALMVDVRRTYLEEHHRAVELQAAYQAERERVRQLEELERAKIDLTRMLSHELLHPVSAIRALALGLARGNQPDDAARRRAIEGLVDQSEQLRDLVERAPDISELRLGSVSLQRERWRVRDLAARVRSTFAHLEDRLSLEVDAPAERAEVNIDVSRVVQVFHNLLANAVKFSPDDTPIRVAIRGEAHRVIVEVVDRGRGIHAAQMGSLFAAFASDRSAREHGLGVGLYVSRLIVEAHGGELWADAAASPGARLVFTIPSADEGDR